VSSGAPFSVTEDKITEGIAELTRADFDSLLFKFEQDMRQHMGIGKVLQDEYGWVNVRLPPTTDDKAFDELWAEWQEWERRQQQHRAATTTRNSRQQRASVGSTTQRLPRPETLHSLTMAASPPVQEPLCRSLRVFAAWKA